MLDEMLKNYSERGHRYGAYDKITMQKWQFHQVCREILALMSRIRELEAENARLKKQCEHLACDVVSALQDYGAPMSDCRSCDYDRFCKRKPGQIEPNWDMCEAAVLKACEPEEAGE